MSDLRDLPDLARDVRERVVTPPYDAVSRRVRARRLRGTAGSIAAAVLVVGGVAVWLNVATTAGPSIPRPAETEGPIPPTDDSQWRAVVDGEMAHPFGQSGTEDGAVAVVWRALEQPEPTFALVIREFDGTVHGRRLDAPVDLTPVPGGWVGVHTAQAWFIGSDGTWVSLQEDAESRTSRAGDIVVTNQYGLWLYSDDRSWARMSFDGVANDVHVNAFGNLLTCAAVGRGRVSVSDADRSGQPNPDVPGHGCVMAGRGDDVVMAALGDEPDGEIPLTGLLRSSDGGFTWQRNDFMALGGVTSVVVTPDGGTLVTGEDGNAFLLSADAEELVEPDRTVGVAFAAGDRVYALSYALTQGPLLYSDDNGRSWQETLLPGMESSEE